MLWKKGRAEPSVIVMEEADGLPYGQEDAGETEKLALPARAEGSGLAIHQRRHLPRPHLPHFTDPAQKRAFANILRFLALVLVFTLVARGTAGAAMPKVQTVRLAAGEIVETVNATATATAAKSVTVEVPAGLTVTQLLVVPGQAVKAGDAIALFDTGKLEEQRARAQVQLEAMQLNLAKLERGEPYDNSALISAQNALAWAQQDQASASTNGQAGIDSAQNALNAAVDEQNAAQDALDTLPADATEEEKDAAQKRLDDAKAAVPIAQTALDTAKRAADEGNTAAARGAQSAADALAAAQAADAKARQAAADAAAQNAIDAKTLRLDIEAQRELVGQFDAIGEDGKLLSSVEGTVQELAAEGGAAGAGAGSIGATGSGTTGMTTLAKISDASGGFRANAALPQAEADKLTLGANADISLRGGYYDNTTQGGATLLSISEPDATGMVNAVFQLPQGDWRQGQNLDLSVVKSKKGYPMCVPLTALRQDQNGYFVFVMEESSTVLGVENVARKVPVTLLAQADGSAAIEGALGMDAAVIGQSSKPLADGDKVRVEQR